MPSYHGFAVLGTPVAGQVPVYQANGSVAWGDAGGGGGAPLSTVLFVDPGTAVPPASQDGSIGAPFDSLQDAIDDDPLRTNFTIMVCPHAVGAGPGAWDGRSITIMGFSTGANLGASANQATIGAITTTGVSSLYLQGIRVDGAIDVTNEESTLCVARDSILAAVTANSFRANNCTLNGNITAGSGSVILDCEFGAIEFANSVEIDAPSYYRAANALVVFNVAQTYIQGSSAVNNESGVAGATVSNALDTLNV